MSESKFSGQFDGSELTVLYHHVNKPEWGVGVALKEEEGKVSIQFEDGKVRAFPEAYYHFIENSPKPSDQAQVLIAELIAMSPIGQAASGKKKARKPVTPAVVFEEQVTHFLELFPGGFESDAYKEAHRKRSSGAQTKKHRDRIVDKTIKWLGPDAWDKSADELFKYAVKIANYSDMIPSKERKAFEAIEAVHHEPVMAALQNLLHGEHAVEYRLDAFFLTLRRAIGEQPSWIMGTYFLGIFHNNQFPLVKRDIYRKQAAAIAPNVDVPKKPSGAAYRRIIDMMSVLRDSLSKRDGLTPADLLDVHNFVSLTLKPKGRKAILDKRAAAAAAESTTTTSA